LDNPGQNTSTVLVAQNAAYGFGGSVFGLVLKVLASIVITRSLGPEAFGIYVLATAILAFAQIIALFGMENSLVRFVSKYRALGDTPRLRGAIVWGIGVASALGVIASALLLWLSSYLGERVFDKPLLSSILRIVALSLPFSTLGHMLNALLQGVKLIKYKVLVEQIWVPVFRFLAAVSAVAMGQELVGIAWAYVVADIMGVFLSSHFVFNLIPEVRGIRRFKLERREMTLFSLPILFSMILNAIINQADVLIMGHYLPASSVGIYGIAQRFVPLIAIPLGVFNSVFAPNISDLASRGKKEELEHQFKVVAKWIFTISLPIFAFLALFPKQILSVFGQGFVDGWQPMIVLGIGQMINAGTGSVGFMLMMTGRPLANLFNTGLLCVTSILLNLYLIPRHAIMGAAFAGAFSIGMVQILRLSEVWYFLGMHPYRRDFFKPALSCALASLVVALVASTGRESSQLLMVLPVWFSVFLIAYVGILWSLRLSPEDSLVVNGLRNRLLKIKRVCSEK
jgi:O-antigen/teichoic acid export membrane protein